MNTADCKKSIPLILLRLFLVAVLIFSACFFTRGAFGVLEQKRDNSLYFADISQGSSFDPQQSSALNAQLEKLTDSIMKYAVTYRNIENFANYAYAISQISTTEKLNNRMREDSIYFAQQQIETDSISEDMVENGFILLSPVRQGEPAVSYGGTEYFAEVDLDKINEYYDGKIAEQSEQIKLNSDEEYRNTVEYLSALDGVGYAVISDGEIVTNLDGLTAENFGDYFSHQYIFIKNGEIQNDGLSDEQAAAISQAAALTDTDAAVLIRFENTLLFNEDCKKIENEYALCRSLVFKNAAVVLACLLLCAVMLILITVLSGRRSIRGKAEKTSFNKVLLLAGILISGAVLVLFCFLLSESVNLFFDPSLGTTWIKVSSDSIIMKASLRVSVIAVSLAWLLCTVKRVVIGKRK